MTSISDRNASEDEGQQMSVVNDKTSITLPVLLAVGGVVIGALLWANSINVAIANLVKDREFDRERRVEMQKTLEGIKRLLEDRQFERARELELQKTLEDLRKSVAELHP